MTTADSANAAAPHRRDADLAGAGPVRRALLRPARLWLAIEFGLLFVLLPTLMYLFNGYFGRRIILALLIGLGVVLAALMLDPAFDRRELFRWPRSWRPLAPVLLAFAVLAPLVGAAVWLFAPESLFALPRERTGLWVFIMIAYPIFSIFPQEIIFRSFFFHRYASIFTTPLAMIVASGLAFGYAHLLFNHWIAVAMTCIGGLLFAWTYHRTRSLPTVFIEHALWGDFVFTIGLGTYFYGRSEFVLGA